MLQSLPAKNERILRVPMTSLQRKYYRWVLTRNFKELNKGHRGQSINTLSNIVIELKKICNHPYLLTGVEENIDDDAESLEALVRASGTQSICSGILSPSH